MNQPQIIEHILEQVRVLFTQLANKENTSDYLWYNLVFSANPIPLNQLNWSECDYYQNMSGENTHLHAYGSCKTLCIKEAAIKEADRLQQIDSLYQHYIKHCLFINITNSIVSNFSLSSSLNNVPPDKTLPLAYCQVAFDPEDTMSGVWQGFDNSKLVIPKILFVHQADKTHIIISVKQNSLKQENTHYETLLENLSADLKRILIKKEYRLSNKISAQKNQKLPPEEEKLSTQLSQNTLWQKQIHNIKQKLELNQVSKIVLARQVNYQFTGKINIKQLIEKLLNTYPDCTVMMLKSAHSYLIACSPEQLVKVDGENVYCDTVGGTINNTQSEIQNSKLKHEHIIIREHIYDTLKQYCHSIHFSDQPSIKNYLHLSHLYTHFSAIVKSPTSVLKIADSLHPTPAVCGIPVKQAMNWIKKNETFNRGLYSGFSGWLNARGEGEMNVILRCAVLSQEKQLNLSLFAGAGIVEGSLDNEEWQETELKLNMLLDSIQQVHQ
jgi:isochorismate synthase